MIASSPPPTVTAVVLAAGASRRMGAVKALLPFATTSVLAHVIATLRTAGVQAIVVVTGDTADGVAAAATALGATVARNAAHLDGGMLSSVKAGLAAVDGDCDAAFILPVDVPLVRPATLRRIIAAAPGQHLVQPTFAGRRGHPPLIGRALFGTILAANGRLSDSLRLSADRICELPVADAGVLADMDLPEDYHRLLARLAGNACPDDDEIDALLDIADTPPATRAHMDAVTRVADGMATRLVAAGLPLDLRRIHAAGRLHDIAKGTENHPEAGAALVAAHGFDGLAPIIGHHKDLGYDGHLDEAAVVFLADKLTRGSTPAGLDARFAVTFARIRDHDTVGRAAVRHRFEEASTVLADVAALTGVAPDQLPFVTAAVAGNN